MNSKRLLRLADHLETIDRKDFNLASNENCAIGHACRMPYFKRLGLKYNGDVFLFDGRSQHDAIARLFSITYFQAEILFLGQPLSSLYKKLPTPKQVAKEIRKFVNAK